MIDNLKNSSFDAHLLQDPKLIFIIVFTFTISFLTYILMFGLKRTVGGSISKISGFGNRAVVNWVPGVNQPLPFASKEWTKFDPKDLKKSGGMYGLMISSITPRPIALVTSVGQNGVINCAPFSYFNMVCHDPPLLVIGCNLNTRTASKKDTLINAEFSGEFVVNIMSNWFVESANHTSGNFPPETSEVEASGLTTVKSELVQPPRIAESAVQYECEVW